MNQLITILGPTAVGKTALTLRMAETLQSPVLSGDAYQIYKGLTIGTAKPTLEELNRVPHYFIDTHEPNDSYSVAEFNAQANSVIDVVNKKGKIPILSGGTGLYVQSLLEGYDFLDVPRNDSLRLELDKIFDTSGLEGLQAYANGLAEKEGVKLPFQDKHRLYRAIECVLAGEGHALLTPSKEGLVFHGPVIGLERSREELYERINLRVEYMVRDGLFEEVEQLLDAGVKADSQAFKGIGYKEIIPYFQGIYSKERAIELVQQHTRQFAKRQITWYKRMPYIQWIHITPNRSEESIYEEAMELVQASFELSIHRKE